MDEYLEDIDTDGDVSTESLKAVRSLGYELDPKPPPPSGKSVCLPRPTRHSNVTIKLSNSSVWEKFNEEGTEMIITNKGRCLFPGIDLCVEGMAKDVSYSIGVDFVPKDDYKYKYGASGWMRTQERDKGEVGEIIIHELSTALGGTWSKEMISFSKLKLTNRASTAEISNCVRLNSFHKYYVRAHVLSIDPESNMIYVVCSEVFPETLFVAVTCYRNPAMKKLKKTMNPFARSSLKCDARENSELDSLEGQSCKTYAYSNTSTVASAKCNVIAPHALPSTKETLFADEDAFPESASSVLFNCTGKVPDSRQVAKLLSGDFDNFSLNSF